jgi:hypothetical protein
MGLTPLDIIAGMEESTKAETLDVLLDDPAGGCGCE